jgi:hypothetical protein
MSFKSFIRTVRIIEISIYVAAFLFLFLVVMPVLGMGVFADVVFSLIGMLGAFALVYTPKSKLIWKNIMRRTHVFYDTLENKTVEGIREFYLRSVRFSPNALVKGHNLFMAYAMHEYVSDEPFEYLHDMELSELAYDDFFYFRAIQIREIMMFRLIQNGQIEEGLALAYRQLDYIERMIDDDQVPQDMVESILNLSSLYRHLIRFINSPNPRTAYAIKMPENAANFDKVRTYYTIARIFIENDMNEEAKIAIEKTKDITGDYRLLERIREYRNEL